MSTERADIIDRGVEKAPAGRAGAVDLLQEPSIGRAGGALRFADRHDAGRQLAGLLERFRDERPVVLGIPRGGVPVAAEVARALSAPLDVAMVCKVAAPGHPEYAVGAVAEGGVTILDEDAMQALGIDTKGRAAIISGAHDELVRRIGRYRDRRPPLSLHGRTVLLVDDGLATGLSARAAARSVHQRGAARVVLAVPVAAPGSLRDMNAGVDEAIAVEAPADLWAIGFWYDDFGPTSDDEVTALLDENGGAEHTFAQEVRIEAEPGIVLTGELILPPVAHAVVAF
ncbi:MAG: phosphoribosyltransferase, partial [Solirubrobacteraceae bacterium]